jgi:alkyl hydroperoxide reductase subunit AhpF
MPGLLKDSDREALQDQLAQMTNTVKLVFFTQALDCESCPITKQVLEEVASLSEKIQLETLNFAIDKEQVTKYSIARIPAIAVVRVESRARDGVTENIDRDYGIRFYGIPAGYEFASLIGDILDVSAGESGLSPESKTALAELKEPLHLQVFTTPT